ncbi:hypothetical protein WN944_006691 [Citrus x changshan-huyou]|uniref:Uncharacterized protein n=1 Tax=Citrus x changshan-huyou TaxID=2935761 RepID=A0AAP0MLI3_9ROSI
MEELKPKFYREKVNPSISTAKAQAVTEAFQKFTHQLHHSLPFLRDQFSKYRGSAGASPLDRVMVSPYMEYGYLRRCCCPLSWPLWYMSKEASV